jgi:methylmalonyl-CoA/ethylmalonyl-CoA epimerase
MIQGVDHIAIACASLETQIPFYRDVLGLEFIGSETVDDQKVKVAFFQAGETRIELLEPTGPDSSVAKYIEKRGEGIHHIAYRSGDLEGDIEKLQGNEVRMIDSSPRPGAHGNRIAFIHPKSTYGVLTELCAPADRTSAPGSRPEGDHQEGGNG